MNKYYIHDSNALQIRKGRDTVAEARSAQGAHRLVKLLNYGLQVEAQRKAEALAAAPPAPQSELVEAAKAAVLRNLKDLGK